MLLVWGLGIGLLLGLVLRGKIALLVERFPIWWALAAGGARFILGNVFHLWTLAIPLSLALLLSGLLLQWHPGRRLFVLGLVCNLLVVALNGGLMPAQVTHFEYWPPEAAAAFAAGESVHYAQPVTAETRLAFLGDWLWMPGLNQTISIGDVLMALGIGPLIAALMVTEVVNRDGFRGRLVRGLEWL